MIVLIKHAPNRITMRHLLLEKISKEKRKERSGLSACSSLGGSGSGLGNASWDHFHCHWRYIDKYNWIESKYLLGPGAGHRYYIPLSNPYHVLPNTEYATFGFIAGAVECVGGFKIHRTFRKFSWYNIAVYQPYTVQGPHTKHVAYNTRTEST